MALKSLYPVCENKKLYLIFSSFSVRSQNHSYKNSIVFRLARHLCSSTSLVIYWRATVASETLTGLTQSKIGDVCLFIYIMFGRMYVILYFDPPYFCVRLAFDPVPNFTKQNPLV